jgi:O-acetyl-ADP-ribose deacetylase (regulator of RNase III)
MIEMKMGDLLAEPAEALVNTVNCVGIMGRGVALQFKNAFPQNFKAYKAACDRGDVQPGKMFVFEVGQLTTPRWIINFPTKRHWRGKSRMEDIEVGLVALRAEIAERGIRSIAIPPLGSGLGGLEWPDVKQRIFDALSGMQDVKVIVFEPAGAPEAGRGMSSASVPRMTPGRAALIGLMDRYLRALLDPFVTLLEVHKLMFFVQEAGEPLRLSFTKAHYGPYAENLSYVLSAIEGHFVAGYQDGGNAPDKQLSIVPGATEEAAEFLKGTGTLARFERVADLVSGFETPFGMELLSTVYWVAKDGVFDDPSEVLSQVHAWGERKRRFSPSQVTLALNTLVEKGWLPDTLRRETAKHQ